MKKTKNLIIIGVIIALAVAAGAYFTMGEGYQGKMKKPDLAKKHTKPVNKGILEDIIDIIIGEDETPESPCKDLNCADDDICQCYHGRCFCAHI